MCTGLTRLWLQPKFTNVSFSMRQNDGYMLLCAALLLLLHSSRADMMNQCRLGFFSSFNFVVDDDLVFIAATAIVVNVVAPTPQAGRHRASVQTTFNCCF